ncbi:BppU family phage baseplate upper protein [Bacillus cereus]|nr:BppU family phage baseplate upper protein [Bacillus cereus]
MISKTITIDIANPHFTKVITSRINDKNGFKLTVTLKEGGYPYNLTGYAVKYEAGNGLGTFVRDDCKIIDASNGVFEYTFSAAAVSTNVWVAYFAFEKGEERFTTQDIKIDLNVDVKQGKIVLENYISDFETLKEKIDETSVTADTILDEVYKLDVPAIIDSKDTALAAKSTADAAQTTADGAVILSTENSEKINILEKNVVNVLTFGAKGDGVTDDTIAIQRALDLAKTLTSVEVIIPNGTYRITNYLIVYKNTNIKMQKKTILFRGHGGGFFKNGKTGDLYTGYDGNGNITIEGGLLDGNVTAFNYGFNHTGWCRGRNLTFRDITFKDVINAHFFDINACDGVLIENCRFLGYKDITPDQSRGFAEAIQISNHTQLGYSDFGVWDGTPSKNVTVRNCYFGSSGTATMGPVATGVGNHGAVYGVYNENIKVLNCLFEGMTFAGVRPMKYNDVVIDGCTFLNCQKGISITNPDGNGESGKDGAGNVIGLPQSGKNYMITNNIFKGTKEEHIFMAAYFNGTNYDRFKNVTVSGNHFVSHDPSANVNSKSAINAQLTESLTISNNTFNDVYRALYGAYNANLVFSDNKVNGALTEAVFLSEPDAAYINQGYTSNVSVRNNHIQYTGRVAIFIQFAHRFFVESNVILHPATEVDNTRSGINCANSARNGIVRGNQVFRSASGNGNKYGLEVSGSCYNVQVFDNYFEGKTGSASISSSNGNFAGFTIVRSDGQQVRATLNSSNQWVYTNI